MNQPLFKLLVLFTFCLPLAAAPVDVPETMEFAGIKLKIKADARRIIEENVQKLRAGGKYYEAKLERIDLYFPIIERILEEEGVPQDFKYLCVQESSLISDAVSSSNAVGYWQFKKETALEVGMVVNGDVDERKHIIAATQGAAKYLKRNNFFLNNWIYALLSYNTGVGGCKALVGDRDRGAQRMEIDSDTHWYILKFLAHRIAFEEVIGRNPQRNLTLLEYKGANGKSLSAIARELDVPEEHLKLYNKWLDRNRIPEDRDYVVIVPATPDRLEPLMAKLNLPAVINAPAAPSADTYTASSEKFPVLVKKSNKSRNSGQAIFFTINGKPGIQAQAGDNSARLAEEANLSLDKFLQYNDLKPSEPLIPGEVYYVKKKRNKAKVHFHTAVEGENLWQLSQKYGVTMKALLRKNRMKKPEKLQHGRVVWLRYVRPSDTPVEIKKLPKPIQKLEPMPVEKEQPKPTTPPTKVSMNEPVAVKNPSAIMGPRNNQGSTGKTETAVIQAKPPVLATESATTTPVSTEATEPVAARPTTQTEPLILIEMHTVAAGQTLYSIAKQYGISVGELRQWNNLTEADSLRIGQKLIVNEQEAESGTASNTGPSPTQAAETVIEYQVQPGDTLYKISKAHGVTVEQLMDWNGKIAPSVSIGEKLKIKR
jgi:membrane-bound lytic murein transglycosylase D